MSGCSAFTQRPQSPESQRVELHPLVETREPDARVANHRFVRSAPRERDGVYIEFVPRQPRRQQRELLFGPGMVERGNEEEEFDHRERANASISSDECHDEHPAFRLSSFVLRHSIDIRHLSFDISPATSFNHSMTDAAQWVLHMLASVSYAAEHGDVGPADDFRRILVGSRLGRQRFGLVQDDAQDMQTATLGCFDGE